MKKVSSSDDNKQIKENKNTVSALKEEAINYKPEIDADPVIEDVNDSKSTEIAEPKSPLKSSTAEQILYENIKESLEDPHKDLKKEIDSYEAPTHVKKDRFSNKFK